MVSWFYQVLKCCCGVLIRSAGILRQCFGSSTGFVGFNSEVLDLGLED